jgi:molybdenum cofactor biosynthesis enzyme MoaA
MRDYFCAQKFYWLKIDAEKKTINSCCKATHENINTKWLEKNPGDIFNTPTLIQDRQDMLDNKRIASCENACWIPEDKNIWSRRLEGKDNQKTKQLLKNYPTTLDLTLSGECNLTCSYCCKNYSSAWRNDIAKNGNYKELQDYGDRYNLNTLDQTLSKASQKERLQTSIYNLIENEIDIMIKNGLDKVFITGGEPLLDHRFPTIITKFQKCSSIIVHSGLGVSENVLRRCLKAMGENKNIELRISAESTEQNFEFNRFGSYWQRFLVYLEIIKTYGIKISFTMSYANLNVTDFVKFNTLFEDKKRNLNIVYEPAFLSPCNLDDDTKRKVIDEIKNSKLSNTKDAVSIVDIIKTETNNLLRQQLSCFVKEFCRRRKTNVDFMPDSFKKWLELA